MPAAVKGNGRASDDRYVVHLSFQLAQSSWKLISGCIIHEIAISMLLTAIWLLKRRIISD